MAANKKWFVMRCPVDSNLQTFLNQLEEEDFTTVSVQYRKPSVEWDPFYEIVCWHGWPIVEGAITIVPVKPDIPSPGAQFDSPTAHDPMSGKTWSTCLLH